MNDPTHTINDQILDRWNGQWTIYTVFILFLLGKEAQNYVVMLIRNYVFGPNKGFKYYFTHMIQRPGDRIANPSESLRASLGTSPWWSTWQKFFYSCLWVVFKSSTNVITENKMHFVWGSDMFSFKDKLGQPTIDYPNSTASDKRTSETSTTFPFAV